MEKNCKESHLIQTQSWLWNRVTKNYKFDFHPDWSLTSLRCHKWTSHQFKTKRGLASQQTSCKWINCSADSFNFHPDWSVTPQRCHKWTSHQFKQACKQAANELIALLIVWFSSWLKFNTTELSQMNFSSSHQFKTKKGLACLQTSCKWINCPADSLKGIYTS